MSDLSIILGELLGPKGWLSGEDAAPHRRDWLDRYGVQPLGVARPADTREVAAVVRACAQAGAAVVPQGGNTGLCGAAVAGRDDTVILSLTRMTRIGAPDPAGGTILLEAGAVLAALHEALEPHGLIFPLHLGAEGSARIGGLIGTNAGGSHAARYGMMQDLVLGLEVVLPDGEIWDGLRCVQKDNAGYQLRKLFCGSEGPLGVVTRAVLKLYPAPARRATALLVLSSHEDAGRLGAHIRRQAGEFLSALEFFPDLGVELILKHLPEVGFPLDSRGPVYLLVELESGSSQVPLDAILETALEWGMEEGLVRDGALAMSDAQRAAFWRLREEQPEGQRLEGPQLKHDISVPVAQVAEFIAQGAGLCEAR